MNSKVTNLSEYKKRKNGISSVLLEEGTKTSGSKVAYGNTRLSAMSILKNENPVSYRWTGWYRQFLNSESFFKKMQKPWNDLSELISISRQWVTILGLFWSFDFLYYDFYENWRWELSKFSLDLPTAEQIDKCASILPWDDLSEKRFNLFKLLWMDLYGMENVSVWTRSEWQNTCETHKNTKGLKNFVRNKMKSLLKNQKSRTGKALVFKDSSNFFSLISKEASWLMIWVSAR